MKAIETSYNGHHFRSRLEARWAVFFDAIGVTWEYEKDGYDLGDQKRYLPDFWLPQAKAHAEVKGQEFTVEEINRCRLLAKLTEHPVVMLAGLPQVKGYHVEMPDGLLTERVFKADPSVLAQATERARWARFEHGEKPNQEKIEVAWPSPEHEALAELDRLIPLAQGEEKDRLIEAKEQIVIELKASGKNYYRKYRRTAR